MGLEQDTYVGVYLKIEAKKIPAETLYTCPEHPDKEFWEFGYCQKCGQALVRAAARLILPTVWDLLPDNNDEFLQVDIDDDYLILLSNERYESPDHANVDLAEIEVTKNMIDNYLRSFQNSHRKSIKKLRAITTRLAIKFGVVRYYL